MLEPKTCQKSEENGNSFVTTAGHRKGSKTCEADTGPQPPNGVGGPSQGMVGASQGNSEPSGSQAAGSSVDGSVSGYSLDEKLHIQILCDTMKKQIISRAFYGWLAYCRHLKTVRTHLADLVNQAIVPPDEPSEAAGGITSDLWSAIHNERGQITIEPGEFYRLVYYGGVEHGIRAKVWPYLLEHYRFEDTEEEKESHDCEMRQKYEMIMSDWLAVEAIVRQRDKELVVANLAKLSSESNNSTSEMPFPFDRSILQAGKSQSNDVFEETEDGSIADSRKSSLPSGPEERCCVKHGLSSLVHDSTPLDNLETEREEGTNEGAHSGAKKQLMRHRQVESVASLCGQVVSGGSLQNIFITNPSIDQNSVISSEALSEMDACCLNGAEETARLPVESNSQCVSPASSNGGIYSVKKQQP